MKGRNTPVVFDEFNVFTSCSSSNKEPWAVCSNLVHKTTNSVQAALKDILQEQAIIYEGQKYPIVRAERESKNQSLLVEKAKTIKAQANKFKSSQESIDIGHLRSRGRVGATVLWTPAVLPLFAITSMVIEFLPVVPC